MNGSSPSVSTWRVSSDWSTAGSMVAYLWLSKTRKKRSSRTSMLDGWIMASCQGSITIRPASISARMSLSLSSTGVTLPTSAAWLGRTMLSVGESFRRYVAIGDSFTEGVGDPDPARPNGLRGWADRVAEVLATRTDDFGYANLAIRGRTLRPILDQQLEPALALRPDLVTIYAGGNDLIRPRCDVDALGEVYDDAIGKLAAGGARVGLFTAFDPGGGGPFARLRGRF